MWQSASVLIIDDNQTRRQEVCAVFNNLGESAHALSASEWGGVIENLSAQAAESAQGLLVLGDLADGSLNETHINSVVAANDRLPIMVLGQESLDLEGDQDDCVISVAFSLPDYQQLLGILHLAGRYRQAAKLKRRQPAARSATPLFKTLVGASAQVQNIREMMNQVADKEVSVMITGESGTGKEVVARNLHLASPRRDKPFVPVNCGAIAAELLESELFGHEKGAFTGAISTRAGRFEMAEGGTLFLDEIGDMPLNMQVKILRVLQERCFERVGGNKTIHTDVRIVAATHRNLESMIEEGTFREDLYYRLNVFPIEMPSLRERTDDIPLLINELVKRLEREKRGTTRFNSAAIMSLCQHPWSGNVRELANLVERMAIMHPQGVVGAQELPAKYQHIDIEPDLLDEAQNEPAAEGLGHTSMASMSDTALLPEAGIDLKEYLTKLERNLIQQALDDAGGVVARAADRLSIRRTTLVEKMRKYDLQRG
jgi:sigma-54 specific flagellar transcriptional regulator A